MKRLEGAAPLKNGIATLKPTDLRKHAHAERAQHLGQPLHDAAGRLCIKLPSRKSLFLRKNRYFLPVVQGEALRLVEGAASDLTQDEVATWLRARIRPE